MPGEKSFEAEYRINKLNPNIHDTEWEMNPDYIGEGKGWHHASPVQMEGDILATLV